MTSTTSRTVFLVGVGLFVLWLAYLARAVVTPLLLALLLAYVLDPVVRTLQRVGLTRAMASGLVVIVALVGLVTVVAVAATRFANEARGFYADVVGESYVPIERRSDLVPQGFTDAHTLEERNAIRAKIRETTWNGARVAYFDANDDQRFEPGYAQMAMEKIRSAAGESSLLRPLTRGFEGASEFGPKVAAAAQGFLTGLVTGGSAVASTFLGIMTLAILFPIYLYYSLVNLAHVYDVTVRHIPVGQRPRVVQILEKIHVTLSSFFRGRLITMLVKGCLLLVVFVAFGVPFSYLCAAFAAIASLVPMVGGIAAGIPPILLVLPEASGSTLIALAACILAIEIFETYVMIPALVGRRVGLHPLTVLVCSLVAFELLGFFGMLVAVPLTAVVKILAQEFVLPELRRRAGMTPRASEAVPAPLPPGGTTP